VFFRTRRLLCAMQCACRFSVYRPTHAMHPSEDFLCNAKQHAVQSLEGLIAVFGCQCQHIEPFIGQYILSFCCTANQKQIPSTCSRQVCMQLSFRKIFTASEPCRSHIFTILVVSFLADRVNGRAYTTVFRPSVLMSVCNVMYCG